MPRGKKKVTPIEETTTPEETDTEEVSEESTPAEAGPKEDSEETQELTKRVEDTDVNEPEETPEQNEPEEDSAEPNITPRHYVPEVPVSATNSQRQVARHGEARMSWDEANYQHKKVQ